MYYVILPGWEGFNRWEVTTDNNYIVLDGTFETIMVMKCLKGAAKTILSSWQHKDEHLINVKFTFYHYIFAEEFNNGNENWLKISGPSAFHSK